VQLLDPPFDRSSLDPGYIRGYVPGVRENGGQYTHAAIWASMAYAALGDRGRAWELLTLINPRTTRFQRTPPRGTRSSRTSSPPTSTPRRRTWAWRLDVYTGSAGWMYRSSSSRCSACGSRSTSCISNRAAAALVVLHDALPLPETHYRIVVTQLPMAAG